MPRSVNISPDALPMGKRLLVAVFLGNRLSAQNREIVDHLAGTAPAGVVSNDRRIIYALL